MTRVGYDDIVVYEVALNEHPLVVGEDDDREDHELIEAVEDRTTVADDMGDFGWRVAVSDPPDPEMERLRYVNTDVRFNVRTEYESDDPFEAVKERTDIDGFDIEDAAMSCGSPTHEDDFDGDIHIDLTHLE